MIAIAGMIVSGALFSPLPPNECSHHNLGDWTILKFGSGHCHRRTGGGLPGLYPHGLCHGWCFIYHGRDFSLYAFNWWVCSPCDQIRGTCPWSCSWLELLLDFSYTQLLDVWLTNLGYTMAISAPAEIEAAATLVQFWNTSVNIVVWITVFGVFIVTLNFCGVRLYGEVNTPWISYRVAVFADLFLVRSRFCIAQNYVDHWLDHWRHCGRSRRGTKSPTAWVSLLERPRFLQRIHRYRINR